MQEPICGRRPEIKSLELTMAQEPVEFATCEAAAIAIIGGADGPTAMIVGAPQTAQEYAACSAPHFEPAARIQWYPVLRVTEFEPSSITLI